ncbi:class I SAM-dependent methyltransferase [Alphaproteobacteria bacterium]|nr:class I SAM-dependent methyltransferase [Alphaproteobacteria bacterium]
MTDKYSHDGWEAYYRENFGEPAWGGSPDSYLAEHRGLLEMNGSDTVLDVACGDGRNSSLMIGKAQTIVGIDLSLSGLRTFRDRFMESGWLLPVLIHGDFLSAPLISSQFDLVVCINSVPHFEVPRHCLEKITSLLKLGGRALFNAFTPNDVAFGLGQQVSASTFQYRDTLFKFHTHDEMKDLLPDNLSIIKTEVVSWEEPDHGDYRKGSHIHEASYFIVEKHFQRVMISGREFHIGSE